jgi:cytochrome c-type biogenesis protein CcmH/NrfF
MQLKKITQILVCGLWFVTPSLGWSQGNYEAVKSTSNLPQELDAEFRDVAKGLRCPTCTGLSVLESDAKFSVQIKDIVLEKVKEGKSKEEILDYFTERYGPWILREPPKEGFNLIAWGVPIGMMLLGPLLIYFLVWRRKPVIGTQGVRPTKEIIEEMEQSLNRLRSGA